MTPQAKRTPSAMGEDVPTPAKHIAASVLVDEGTWRNVDVMAVVTSVVDVLCAHFPDTPGGTADILFSDDAFVAELNWKFRSNEKPTNVLAFPATPSPTADEKRMGDVVLADGVCAREAHAKSVPLTHHATHITLHGLLHLMGYDHQCDEEQMEMEALEVEILALLGISDPYCGS